MYWIAQTHSSHIGSIGQKYYNAKRYRVKADDRAGAKDAAIAACHADGFEHVLVSRVIVDTDQSDIVASIEIRSMK